MHLLQLAQSYGLTGTAAQQATKDAIGLEAATGHAAASTIRLISNFRTTGDTQGLTRLLPILRGIHDPTERAAMATKLLAGDFKTAEAVADTFSGQMKQLDNDTHILMAQLGGIIAGPMKPFIAAEREMMQWFKALSPEVKTVVVALGSLAVAVVAFSAVCAFATPIIAGLDAVLGVLFSPMVLLGALGIAAVGTAVTILAKNVGGFANLWKLAVDMAKQFKPVIDEIAAVVNAVFSAVSQLVSGFVSAGNAANEMVPDRIMLGWKAFVAWLLEKLIYVEFQFSHINETMARMGMQMAASLPKWVTGMTDAQARLMKVMLAGAEASNQAGFTAFFKKRMEEINKSSQDGSGGIDGVTKSMKALKHEMSPAELAGSAAGMRDLTKMLNSFSGGGNGGGSMGSTNSGGIEGGAAGAAKVAAPGIKDVVKEGEEIAGAVAPGIKAAGAGDDNGIAAEMAREGYFVNPTLDMIRDDRYGIAGGWDDAAARTMRQHGLDASHIGGTGGTQAIGGAWAPGFEHANHGARRMGAQVDQARFYGYGRGMTHQEGQMFVGAKADALQARMEQSLADIAEVLKEQRDRDRERVARLGLQPQVNVNLGVGAN
jgi:hypothetical protein